MGMDESRRHFLQIKKSIGVIKGLFCIEVFSMRDFL